MGATFRITVSLRDALVTARLAEQGEVVLKRNAGQNGTVRLTSSGPEGQSYESNLRNKPGRLMWVWPAVRV